MRIISNICRLRGPLMTLAFIASLLEWIVIVRSKNIETTAMTSGIVGTVPSKIKIPIGGDANITCHTFEDENSSMIMFETVNRTITQPSEEIIIINDKTAILTIRNATKHKLEYYCTSTNGKRIGKTVVYVGSPPGEIKDFTCRSYDFYNMTCTFTRPANFIYTKYELNYTDSPNKFCNETCKDLRESGDHFTCYLNQRSDSFYVAMRDMYFFNLTGTNELGTRSQMIAVKHSNIVVPAKLNIKIENITIDSVTLTWQNYRYEYYKNIALEYEILLEPKGLKRYFATDYDYCNARKCRVIIKNLKYAYYNYLLTMRAKVKEAQNIDNLWSEAFSTEFITKEKLPDYPPSTAPGSFYINSGLQLYWRDLMEYERNGPGFYYNITEIDTNGTFISSKTTENSTIELQWDEQKQKERVYYIRSANNLGQSFESAIKVYSDRGKDYRPNFVSKVYKNNAYKLSWKAPKKFQELMNYTIFWCTEERATINRCSGSIDFEIVDRIYQNYTLKPMNGSLNLAVSANYKNYSTGMNWACNADESMRTTFEPRLNPLSASLIRVDWSIYRICSSIIEGYILTYCQISKQNNPTDCISEPITLHSNGEQKNFEITDLNPFSKYRFNITMISKKNNDSVEMFAETMEAAPTKPTNLTLVKKTSHSATVSWLPPEKFNGKLQYYTIIAESKDNNLTKRLYVNGRTSFEDSNTPLNYTFNNLTDFTQYKIYVIAHTVESSPPSEPIKIKTLIGKLNPPLIDSNMKDGIVNWTAPLVPSGRIAYYEVALLVKNDDNKTIAKVVPTMNNECRFRIPDCHGSDFKYYTKVRVIYIANVSEIDNETRTHLPKNDIEDNTQKTESLQLECTKPEQLTVPKYHELKLTSDWQTGHNGQVYNCPVKFSTFFSIAIIILFLMLIASAYGGCKKYKKMNNIDVVLPPGLVDHLSAYKTNNVGYGSKSDKEPSDLSRSNDCLVNNKENFHLLGSLGMNSGNTPNGVITMADNSHDVGRFDFEQDYNHAFQREENSNGSYDDHNSSQSTDSVEINDMSSVSYTNGPLNNDSQLNIGAFQSNITTVPALNGYVSITPASEANIGYITTDRINSFQTNLLQDEEAKKSVNVNDINPNSSTSMYVTPAQLAQIGRSERLH